MILTLIILKIKGIEIDEIQFYNTFNEHIWFNLLFFILKIMNFEDVDLTKVVDFVW
jgi:hypothetical protein